MDRHRRSLAGQALQFGTPYIVPPSGDVDTLVHNASYTITALNGVPLSGMGTKVWSQPAWDNCEGGGVGALFHDANQVYPTWRSFGATAARYTFPGCDVSSPNPAIIHPSYDAEYVRGGPHCTKAVKQHYYSELVDGGTAVNLQGSNYVTCADLPATLELYCTWWRYHVVPPGKQAFTPSATRDQGSRNWKHCNCGNSTDYGGTGFPQQRYDVYPCNEDYGGSHQELNFANSTGGSSGAEVAQTYGPHLVTDITDQGVWQRFEMLTRHGTVANKDWCFGHWIDGVLKNWADPTTNPSQADQPILDPPDGRPWRALSINFFCSPSSGKIDHYTPEGYPRYYILPNFQADFWLDDLYLDCSRARVEVGNAATWAACTAREIQPWTAWADGAVTVSVNHGALAHGPAYLYAIKPDGTPFDTNGHEVTLW